MGSFDINIVGLQEISIAGVDTHARPYEWDDPNNPTMIISMHTTCPKCSQRLVISDSEGNLIKHKNKNYVYCPNCDYGRDEFGIIMKDTIVVEEDPKDLEYYNLNVLSVILDNDDFELTKKLNGF